MKLIVDTMTARQRLPSGLLLQLLLLQLGGAVTTSSSLPDIQQQALDGLYTCCSFTQPPMRRMRICFTDVFFCFLSLFCFFAFSVRQKNTRQPFSGMAERIFMKLLPNDRGESGVSNVIPKWGLGPRLIFWGLKTTHCALGGDAWRVTEN